MYNNPIISFFIRSRLIFFKIKNGLFLKKGKEFLHQKKNEDRLIIFDFSNPKYIHYGDILFFLPLLYIISKNSLLRISVIVNIDRFNFLQFILNSVDSKINLRVINNSTELPCHSIIITSPYNLFDYTDNSLYIVGLGNPSSSLDIPYPIYLADIFLKNILNSYITKNEIEQHFNDWREKFKDLFKNTITSYTGDNLIWVCPYISSGRFRDFFSIKYRSIIQYAIVQGSIRGLCLALVGSNNDNKKLINSRMVVDYRGHEILDMMILANSSYVKMGIGFDNFWMHFFDLINKQYIVKFRGRFSKSQHMLHLNSINISFLSAKNKRTYI